MEERRPWPLLRLLMVGVLSTSAAGTGYYGWKRMTAKKPTPVADLQTPPEMMAALQQQAEQQNAPADAIPADPSGPQDWRNAGQYRTIQYQEPVASPAEIPQPPGGPLEAPPEENPYRGSRRGGSMYEAPASPIEQPPAQPGVEVPADPGANLGPPGNYYPENPGLNPAVNQNLPPVEAPPPVAIPQEPPALNPQTLNAPPPQTQLSQPAPYNEPPAAYPPATNQRSLGAPVEMERPLPTPAPLTPGHGAETAATPGDRRLEGPQVPAVVIEKSAPPEIQINKPAAFKTHVRNAGQSPASRVIVTDQVPRGTQLVETKPQAQVSSDGLVTWDLGRMEPGADALLEMTLMPDTEGQIGSVAQVTCLAAATARTICTRPQLVIDHVGPQQVLMGETVSMSVTVSNPGTGPATGVVVEEDVPAGLSHPAGKQLELELGTLKPGESRKMELTLTATQAGQIENIIRVRGEGKLRAEHRVGFEVVAPQLQVDVAGPKRRYLERQATYQLTLGNPGTASARDVDLVAYLPKGMKFVNADSEGRYDATRHAVLWSLEELPARKSGTVKVTTLPLETGDHVLRTETRAARGLTAQAEQAVLVEAAAELLFSVVDMSDPIEIGAETSYEIRVVNNGTRAASNVRLAVGMPPELRALGGDGPAKAAGDETRVIFEPLVRLQPREEAVFKVTAQATRAGDARIKVQLSSDEEPTPVTKEESTRVYQDR